MTSYRPQRLEPREGTGIALLDGPSLCTLSVILILPVGWACGVGTSSVDSATTKKVGEIVGRHRPSYPSYQYCACPSQEVEAHCRLRCCPLVCPAARPIGGPPSSAVSRRQCRQPDVLLVLPPLGTEGLTMTTGRSKAGRGRTTSDPSRHRMPIIPRTTLPRHCLRL